MSESPIRKNNSECRTPSHLQTDTRNLVFLQSVVLDDVRQGAAFHVLHDDPKLVILHQVRLQEIDDIRVLGLFHNQDLVHDEFLAGLM